MSHILVLAAIQKLHSMQKVISFLLGLFILTNSFGQTKKKVMIFLEPEFSKTIMDRTKQNNLWGIGIGLQTIFTNKTKFSPTFNIIDDFIFLDDKVFRTNSDGSEMKSIQNVLKIFVGTNFNPTENFYLSFSVGPSFINGQTLLGINPSIGFFFPKTKRWTSRLSYTNIFNRNSGQNENYSSVCFSVGLRVL